MYLPLHFTKKRMEALKKMEKGKNQRKITFVMNEGILVCDSQTLLRVSYTGNGPRGSLSHTIGFSFMVDEIKEEWLYEYLSKQGVVFGYGDINTFDLSSPDGNDNCGRYFLRGFLVRSSGRAMQASLVGRFPFPAVNAGSPSNDMFKSHIMNRGLDLPIDPGVGVAGVGVVGKGLDLPTEDEEEREFEGKLNDIFVDLKEKLLSLLKGSVEYKLHSDWFDSLNGSPSQCYKEIEYKKRHFVIYLRWRHSDPWTAEIIECEQDGIFSMRGESKPLKVGYWSQYELHHLKKEVDVVVKNWLARNI